jgi:nucleotide-binding universal stress UspA family protein
MFKRLLIANDLSQASHALMHCLEGLRAFGAQECLLLQCMDVKRPSSSSVSFAKGVLHNLLQNEKALLEKTGYKVETRIVEGAAKNEIHRIATEENYSMIVVGAQEYSLASEWLVGGLAYEVIWFARKPVLLVRLEEGSDEELSCRKSLGCDFSNHILYPTDFSDNALQAFAYVVEMVVRGVKKVTLMHVQDRYRIHPYLEARLDEFNRIDVERLERLKEVLQKQGNVEVEILIKYGSPSVEVLTAVRELNVQLVVMGSQGRGYVQEFFLGSVSHHLARHSTSSVLLIPAKRESN